MKVLLINGSANSNGCTYTALNEVAKTLMEENIQTEIINIGKNPIRDCVGCRTCKTTGKCVFDDDIVNVIIGKAKNADGFVFGSPVYYAHPSGRLLSLMDRLFYANGSVFKYKPACAVVSARRAGTTASLDVITKHFAINQMPIISSNYWHMVHGNKPEEVLKDEEGMQIMRVLGKNMAWMLKCIDMGRNSNILPSVSEDKIMTNFIR